MPWFINKRTKKSNRSFPWWSMLIWPLFLLPCCILYYVPNVFCVTENPMSCCVIRESRAAAELMIYVRTGQTYIAPVSTMYVIMLRPFPPLFHSIMPCNNFNSGTDAGRPERYVFIKFSCTLVRIHQYDWDRWFPYYPDINQSHKYRFVLASLSYWLFTVNNGTGLFK